MFSSTTSVAWRAPNLRTSFFAGTARCPRHGRAANVGSPAVTIMASRTARACVHFETELVDELLGGDERRVGGGVECVTAVIALLAPDQLLGARRGVGVDRIERASVVARGGVRRVLLHANRIETGTARERRARIGALRRSSNLRRRLQRLAVHGVRAQNTRSSARTIATRSSSLSTSAAAS